MQRAIGLRAALSVNVISMIGIGPLITIPLVLQTLGGPLALLGWIAGALVALCDGFVWAELSSRFPGSGGTYVYLRNAFGASRLGGALAFLVNWQFLLAAPCLLASGYIGFASYAAYLVPALAASPLARDCTAAGVGLLTVLALLAPTRRVAIAGTVLAGAALATILIVTFAASSHFELHRAFTLDRPMRFDMGLLAGLGSALFITLYDYTGYASAALLGDEVREPNRTIPRAILGAIALIAALYLLFQTAVLGAIDWHTLLSNGAPTDASQYVASTIVEQAWGPLAARAVTVLVLVTAFASVFGVLLGFSRIPFAAARDGAFLPAFARLHPRLQIPHVSLIAIGVLSIVACAFTLDDVIAFLTAGLVLIQSVAQIVALFVVRRRDPHDGYHMPLYPLPALVALGGWLLAFWYTGPRAIALGLVWLLVGCGVYAVHAARARLWPFAVTALLALAILVPMPSQAAIGEWSAWNTDRIDTSSGTPVFRVDDKPFFVYGAAFFYERIPRSQWRNDLLAYRAAGINTIDIYAIWNWHEPADGRFDFTGSTRPERDLNGLLHIVHDLGMHVILRPGPVIRNEWKNGGYPDWLLQRPEYAMPLHDVLEGRYPATATYQNAHADAAADEWLHNATHLTYASRWLDAVLRDVAPYASDVLAIALDDDQGAYIDNDTWPAPHWHAYMDALHDMVQRMVGTRVPLFINTFQMKVTASAPVWAWGNWYQSDAYRIGDHDLGQLSFSTALLGTQDDKPLMASEFQAGWLQGADELQPRAAAPENTTMALHRMLQLGVHGVVNFPLQDTIDPPGYEAPWTNIVYAWRSSFALSRCGMRPCANARLQPTQAFAALISRYGTALATMHPAYDAAIVWMPSAYDERTLSNADIGKLADITTTQLETCRRARISCHLIDARYARQLPAERYVVVPDVLHVGKNPRALRFLQTLQKERVVRNSIEQILRTGVRARTSTPNAALLVDDRTGHAAFDVFNEGERETMLAAEQVRYGSRRFDVPALRVEAGGACTVFFLPQRSVLCTQRQEATDAPPAPLSLDGAQTIARGQATVLVAAAAGARIFSYRSGASGDAFTSIGAFRDDVAVPRAPSPRDYIAPYTHPLEAGTYNRGYACAAEAGAMRCTYAAPDLAAAPVTFTKTYRIRDDGTLEVTLRASADAATLLAATPGTVVSAPGGTVAETQKDGYRLIRITYPAQTDLTVTVVPPGGAERGANRP